MRKAIIMNGLYKNQGIICDAFCDMALGENRGEFDFPMIVNFCHEDGLFAWMLVGMETNDGYKLNFSSASQFGLKLNRYTPKVSGGYCGKDIDKPRSPRKYRRKTPEGEEVVVFGCFGEGRGQRFYIESN